MRSCIDYVPMNLESPCVINISLYVLLHMRNLLFNLLRSFFVLFATNIGRWRLDWTPRHHPIRQVLLAGQLGSPLHELGSGRTVFFRNHGNMFSDCLQFAEQGVYFFVLRWRITWIQILTWHIFSFVYLQCGYSAIYLYCFRRTASSWWSTI